MGDVGHELLTALFRVGQRVGHGVESGGQVTDLVLVPGVIHPDIVFSHAEAAHRVGHLPQGLYLLHGEDGAGDAGDAHYDHGHKEEQCGQRFPQHHQIGGGSGHEDVLRLHAVALAGLKEDGGAGGKVDAGVDAEVGHAGVDAVLDHLTCHVRGDRAAHVVRDVGAVGYIAKNGAAGVTEYQIGIGDVRQGGAVDGKGVLRRVKPPLKDDLRHAGGIADVFFHALFFFAHHIAIAQGRERGSQQNEGQQDQPGGQQELAPKEIVSHFAAFSTTSNL